jgi:hypothetical protein
MTWRDIPAFGISFEEDPALAPVLQVKPLSLGAAEMVLQTLQGGKTKQEVALQSWRIDDDSERSI